MESGTGGYILGHSEQELARLERQADLFRMETVDTLRRAGIAAGMHVVDVGCGTGDVAMVAAEIVGPTGSILGIDTAAKALDSARARAAQKGFDWVRFDQQDLRTLKPDRLFDAVTGRFVFLHLDDPAEALRRLTRILRPGGIAAFIEMDIEQASAVPQMSLMNQCIAWIAATYRGVGVEPNMGSRLYATFRSAGLKPELSGSCRIESGPDAYAYAYAEETLRSLMPAVIQLGIASAEDVGLDTLHERLRSQAIDMDPCLFHPRLVGAWARTDA